MRALFILITVFFVFTANAKELETVVRCEQFDDADVWLEVGVTLNDGPGYMMYVVKHNVDDGSKTLVRSDRVFKTVKPGNKELYYSNQEETVRLGVNDVYSYFLTTDEASVFFDRVECFDNRSPITWD